MTTRLVATLLFSLLSVSSQMLEGFQNGPRLQLKYHTATQQL